MLEVIDILNTFSPSNAHSMYFILKSRKCMVLGKSLHGSTWHTFFSEAVRASMRSWGVGGEGGSSSRLPSFSSSLSPSSSSLTFSSSSCCSCSELLLTLVLLRPLLREKLLTTGVVGWVGVSSATTSGSLHFTASSCGALVHTNYNIAIL